MSQDILYSILDEDGFYEKKKNESSKAIVQTKEIEKNTTQKRVVEEEREMVDGLPEIDEEITPEPDHVNDEFKSAVKMAFLGAGQGGGNLADAFWQIGYRRVAVVNTTSRDMQRLKVPEQNRHLLKSEGGAGKDPSVGRRLVESEIESIYSLIRNTFKDDLDHIMICIGSGGGTGSGASLPLVQLCKNYLKSIGKTDVEKKVGVIVTLPTKDESAAVQKNALEVLIPLIELAEKGELSPLVIVDNARVMQLYGKASVVGVWEKANKNIAALFHVFNLVCAEDSDSVIVTCDPQDYKSVLQSGVLAFGRTKLDKIDKPTDIADAVRENVKKGLLVEGLDLSKATHGAALLMASQENLEKISQESLEMAFGSLNRLMHQGPETTLHRGVYSGSGSGVFLYTIISGLGRPQSRIAEMQAKAGK